MPSPGAARRSPSRRPPGAGRPPALPPTTVVGSYPQPGWLIDRERLAAAGPARARRELWRLPEEAHQDATRLAIADMERAGLDVVGDEIAA